MRTKMILAVVLIVAFAAAVSMARPPYTRHRVIYVRAAVSDTTITIGTTLAASPDAAQISVAGGDVWVTTNPGANFFKIGEDKAFTVPSYLQSVTIHRSTGTSAESTIVLFWE